MHCIRALLSYYDSVVECCIARLLASGSFSNYLG